MTDEQRDCWAATGSCTRTGKISTIIGLRIGAEGLQCVHVGEEASPQELLIQISSVKELDTTEAT